MKPYPSALLVLPLLAACSSSPSVTAPSPSITAPSPSVTASSHSNAGSLSPREVAEATGIARRAIADAGASVYSVTATARRGTITGTNTGHPCTSGRVLTIKLIGEFPHTVTTGHPIEPGKPVPDFTVRAAIISADAKTGVVCLSGVQTAERGEPKPLRHGTALRLEQDG